MQSVNDGASGLVKREHKTVS